MSLVSGKGVNVPVGFSFSLPVPPSVNHCYRRVTTPTGRRMNVLTSKGKKWFGDAQVLVTNAANRAKWTLSRDEKIIVKLWCYWPDARCRDVHNLDKVLLDALEGIIYENDRYALPQWMDWSVDRENPRVDIVISRHEGATHAAHEQGRQ